MYPYESRADGDLSFKKGDQMILIDSRYFFCNCHNFIIYLCFFVSATRIGGTSSTWARINLATFLATSSLGKKVLKAKSKIFLFTFFNNIFIFIFFRWFAGKIPRALAEKLVMNPGLPRGTYLIRERETEQGTVNSFSCVRRRAKCWVFQFLSFFSNLFCLFSFS